MSTVRAFMTAEVTTIPLTTYVSDAKGILVGKKISGAPIVDSQEIVVGILSLSDIVHFESTGGDAFSAQVYEISTHNIVTVSPDNSIQDAAKMMASHGLHRLVVVEDNRVIGILSALDIVRALANG